MPAAWCAACRRWSTASPGFSRRDRPAPSAGRRYDIGVIEHSWCAPYLGADRAGLPAHRARSAQCRKRAARPLRRDGRTRQRLLRIASFATRRRSWSAPGCRAFRRCSPPRRPMPELVRAIAPAGHGRGLSERAAATPLPRGRRRGGDRLLRQHGVPSRTSPRCGSSGTKIWPQLARALAAAGLAAGGEESGGGPAITQRATRGSR